MISTAAKLIALLDRRERGRLALLFVAMLIMAVLEMVGIAAVLPFLTLAAEPAQLQENAWLAWAYDRSGFATPANFLIALGVMAVVALVLSNAWMAATIWAQCRFAYGRMHSLGVRLLRHYASQPYVFFLRRNSSDLGKNVLHEVELVTNQVLMPVLRLAARGLVVLAIGGLLLAFDPLLAVLVTLVLGGAYGVFYVLGRRKLARIGAARVAANTARYKAANELFGAIKDVKLMGKEEALTTAFISPSARFARHRATAQVLGEVPRYALEAIAFGGILLIAVYLLGRGGSFQQVVPALGLYAVAGYRLMPSLQQVYGALTQLRFGRPALDNLYYELNQETAWPRAAAPSTKPAPHVTVLPLRQRLELDRVSFTYPGTCEPTLENVSLNIAANTTVGIMGPSGSGKTTLVDLLLGLLRTDTGEIRIDGVELNDANLCAWQNGLGYVPQHIYLADDTIARNIAFGVPRDRIDMAAVERAARLAQIHAFVSRELPAGYATGVGERGVRLSGGQRQRIGIARALYHDPGVLVFDEATSALDDETETALMEAIETLSGQKTLIIVAHRLSTLAGC